MATFRSEKRSFKPGASTSKYLEQIDIFSYSRADLLDNMLTVESAANLILQTN